MVQVYDVGRAINPTLVEGQIEGGAMMGLGLGLLEEAYPYYPSLEHRGEQFGSYLAPSLVDLPEFENVILENPSIALAPNGPSAEGFSTITEVISGKSGRPGMRYAPNSPPRPSGLG